MRHNKNKDINKKNKNEVITQTFPVCMFVTSCKSALKVTCEYINSLCLSCTNHLCNNLWATLVLSVH